MRLLGTLLVLSAAVLAQTPDLKTASGYPKMVQKQVTVWLERVADKMPEEEYAFKPDPPQADKWKQYPFPCVHSVDRLLDAAGASFKDPTNTDVDDEANEKNEVPRLDSHGFVTISNSSWPNRHSFTESRRNP